MNGHQKFVVKLNFVLLLLGLFPIFTLSQQFFVVLSDIDPNLKINQKEIADGASSVPEPTESDFDEFIAPEAKADYELDPGSWNPIFEPDGPKSSSYLNFSSVDGERENGSTDDEIYYKAVGKMVNAASRGDEGDMAEAASEIEAIAMTGHPHAQSVMGFLYGMGIMKERNKGKAFLNHYFAAEGGNMQSKMALAYIYYRQKMNDKAVKLYAELAETAVNSLLISKDPPAESIRIHSGTEENKEALRKSRGEEDEDFQITEYQALKGNAGAMYKIGYLYYFGLRGVRRDHAKAFSWFLKAVEKGEPRSMELLGEIYARGAGVERNYTKAFEWLTLATKHQHYSAYNGLGYLYVMGYGVEARNITMAKKYFIKAAKSEEPAAALYNLGVMFLKGIGVNMDLIEACNHFVMAGNAGQIKAYYQLAKMFHTGVGVKENIFMAASLFKIVAERGPWSSMCRWALESYLKGDVGKALLLYSRLAELGYEVHQSNAAWILDKYGEHSMCMGESGICTEAERYQHSHALWWLASEQGNEHAALLIGDAYYYGRGIDRDFHRAAEAYFHAKSQSNAQAMFNLGYMHERGEGLPVDLHLAKRYYDQALEKNPAAKLPVTLALASLWLRKNYADSFLIDMIDSLPEIYPKLEKWVEDVIMEEGNATILTLFVCLLTVLYLRERQRRHAVDRAGDMAPRQPIVEHHGLHAAH